MIKNGDIFITELQRNFYGAFRILNQGILNNYSDNYFYLIAVTSYISEEKPNINDQRLLIPLKIKRFSYENRPKDCIGLYSQNIIKNNFEFLGNIPLSNIEEQIKFKFGGDDGYYIYGTKLKDFGDDAFFEWRWENEKQEFINEIEDKKLIEEEKYNNRILTPKKMMDDKTFWEIISLFNWENDDTEKIVEPAIKHLSKLKVTDIKQFEENLTFKLYNLDTINHAMNIGKYSYDQNNEHFSVDLFLYARCKAIANGQEFYELVLNDPTKMPKDDEFEELLTISENAYELKTKKSFDYTTGCDYETFSNKAGWK